MQEKESKTNYHFIFSISKSIFRILGFIFLSLQAFEISALILGFSEILGIIEEF